MKIKFLLLGLFSLIITNIFADGITIDEARQVAKNFYYEKSGIEQTKINFVEEVKFNSDNTPEYYVFNLEDEKGFVIISGNDLIAPVIGYSLNNTFSTQNQPHNVAYWMQTYSNKIEYKIENNISADENIKNNWQKYNTTTTNFIAQKTDNKGVSGLVDHIKWGQTDGWDQYCPDDAITGCVATAMGIIMKYHEFPTTGNGSYTYTPDGYSSQTVNYDEQTYSWGSMNNTSPTSSAALLIYNAGVSVQMQYGNIDEGSSAYTIDVMDALWYYFLYQYAEYHERAAVSDADWKAILKDDLDMARPVFYGGQKTDGGGHAFICDGYDDSDYFHYNFGWEGYNNGFYSIDDPQGYSDGQECLTGITPDNSFFAKESRKNVEQKLNAGMGELQIYPNPTNGVFNIYCKYNIVSVEIYNITGALVLRTLDTQNIDLTENASGIYFININTENETFNQKIILK